MTEEPSTTPPAPEAVPLYMAEYMERNAREHGEMRAEFQKGISGLYGVMVVVLLGLGAAAVAVMVQLWPAVGGG